MTPLVVVLVFVTLGGAVIGAAYYIVQVFTEDRVLRAYRETGVDHADNQADGWGP